MEKIRASARREEENGNTRIRDLMNEINNDLTEHSTSLPSENGEGGGGGGGGNGDETPPPSPNGGAEFHVEEDNIIGDKKKGLWKKLLYLAKIIGIVALLYSVYSACNQEGASCGTMDGLRKSLFDGNSSNISIPTGGSNVSSSPPSIKGYNDTAQQVSEAGIVVSSSSKRADEDVMPQLLYFTLGILHRTKTVASDKDDRIKSLESTLQITTESETSLEGEVNGLKQSVEAGNVLEIELRREITDLKDQLNGTEKKLNDTKVENEQLKGDLTDTQDELLRFKKKAEQQQHVIQGAEAEKDEMEKTNRELQDTVTRYETEAARQRERIATLETENDEIEKTNTDTVARYETEASQQLERIEHQQATIESLGVDKWMLQCACPVCLLLGMLALYSYQRFVPGGERSSDNTISPIKGVGDVSTDSDVTNPSPLEDSSDVVDHPSPPDESKSLVDKDVAKVSTTSAAEGLVDSSEGVTDADAAAADVSGSEGVSSSNNESLSAIQSQVDSVSDSSSEKTEDESGLVSSVSGSDNEPKPAKGTTDTSSIEESVEEDGSSSAAAEGAGVLAERVFSSDNVPILDSNSSSTIGHSSSASLLFGGDASQGSSSDVVPALNGGTSNSSCSANTETHTASDEDKKENVPPRRQVLPDGCDVYKGWEYRKDVLGDSQK